MQRHRSSHSEGKVSIMRSQTSHLLVRFKIFLAAILPLVFAAFAQAQTASVTGTITDASGGAVPGASITAKNLGTTTTRTGTSDAAGAYSIANVPVGRYDVTVEKEGFTPLHFQNVELTVAQNLTLNGSLSLGAISQA